MTTSLQTAHYRFTYTRSTEDPLLLRERHCHTRYELIVVLEGDITITLEGKNYWLSDGQALLIPPLYYHTVTANRQGVYRRITVLFEASAVPAPLQNRFAGSIAVFAPAHPEKLQSICTADNSEFYGPLAKAWMITAFYACIEEKQDSIAEPDEFLRQALAYIDAHLCQRITLDDLAALSARSKSSFCHLFEEKMRISPKQYILQKKLAYAHKLIREGTTPTEAALRIGYENYSNFYRMYKKRYGYAPAKKQ